MTLATTEPEDLTLTVAEEIRIDASLQDSFAALLEQMGPHNEGPDGTAMPMTLEARPGGRWFRDLGGTTAITGDTCRRSSDRLCSRLPVRCSCPTRSHRTYNTGSPRRRAEHS